MQTILITGTSRGIGLELARQYAADPGWRVFAACRKPGGGDELARIASGSSGRLTVHKLDVASAEDIEVLAAALHDQPLDLLVNNAGVAGEFAEGFAGLDEQTWLNVLRVNTIAPARIAAALLEQIAASRRKVIATISSRMGSISDADSGGYYAYRSSKAAVNMVMKNMAVDLRGRGITVVALSPGWVRTDMGSQRAPLSPAESVGGLRKILESVTLKDSGKFFSHDGPEIPW